MVGFATKKQVIPNRQTLPRREPDLVEVYTTEWHLLYVACTRARDWLLVSGVRPVSEFLADLEQV